MRTPALLAGLVLLAALPSCTGHLGGDDPAPDPAEDAGLDCSHPALADSPLRRLTRWEYNNTVHDLLGDTTAPADQFSAESRQLGFTNGAASTPMSAVVVEEYEGAARALAATAIKDPAALLGCDPAAKGEDACADQFLTTFGRRAFRRPLTPAELAAYHTFYTTQKAAYGFTTAIELFVGAILQTPSFLYRVELGMPDPAAPDALRLDGYEVASRLSYLLWGTMPDDALLDVAAKGDLATTSAVRAQAVKMLDDPRGAAAIQDFYVQWGRLGATPTLHKNAAEFTPAIGNLMLTEARLFVDDVVRHGDGTMSALLTTPATFINADLAAFYGIKGPTGSTFERVDLDPARYSGLLTQGALMATLAHEEEPSQVYRGKFVLEQLLCNPPPPPPDNVNLQLPVPDPNKSARVQLEELTAKEPCHTCHIRMNPIGFAMDHLDAVGRWRDLDGAHPLDTTGVLVGPGDASGSFTDTIALAKLLAKSEAMRACMVGHWFHYAYGRGEGPKDACSMTQLQSGFEASGGNVKTLLLDLIQTPAFLYRVARGDVK
jgi:hypothetical protein